MQGKLGLTHYMTSYFIVFRLPSILFLLYYGAGGSKVKQTVDKRATFYDATQDFIACCVASHCVLASEGERGVGLQAS